MSLTRSWPPRSYVCSIWLRRAFEGGGCPESGGGAIRNLRSISGLAIRPSWDGALLLWVECSLHLRVSRTWLAPRVHRSSFGVTYAVRAASPGSRRLHGLCGIVSVASAAVGSLCSSRRSSVPVD